jgi:hypothetical protein
MAQISVFAQPGLAFMGAEQAARENRLATAQQQAAQAAAEAQQQLRQQAFTSLQGASGAQANPQAMAAQLAAAGDTEGARLALSMGTAQETQRTREEARARQRQQDESAIFTNASQSGLDNLDPIRNRLRRVGSPLADADDNELRASVQAYGATTPPPNAQRFTAVNPATGQEEIAFVNPRTQEVTFSGIRAANRTPTVNVQPTDVAGIIDVLGGQGVRAIAQGELQQTAATAQAAVSVLSLVDQFEGALEAAGPQAVAGILGDLRQAGTGLVGMARTLSTMGETGAQINNYINSQVQDARSGADQETFNALFGNPELGAVQLLGNALNYANARLRHGPGMLSNQDVNRNAVVRGGLQDDAQMLAAVRSVRENAMMEYERARQRNESIMANPEAALRVPPLPEPRARRSAQGQPASAAPASVRPLRDLDSVPLSEWTDAELRAYEGAGGE